MKKIISAIAIIAILTLIIFTGNTYAVALDTLDVQTDKTTVRPGEEVKVTIQFGQDLGAYTFDVSYDKNIFEYVSAEGGTANDTTTKVKVQDRKSAKKRKLLDTYGINLTDLAREGKLDKIAGRNNEINRTIQILNRRTKNNPVLIGEPGVGKTAIAEALAMRIV